MDPADYRKQYGEQLRNSASKRPNYTEAIDGAADAATRKRALQAGARPQNDDERLLALSVGLDRSNDAGVRIDALKAAAAGNAISESAFHDLLNLLRDRTEQGAVRLGALRILQAATFSSLTANAERPAFLDVLRGLVDDDHRELREQALELLAVEKDDYAQRRLIESIESRSDALISSEKAIQLLGYDVHADHYSLLQDVVQRDYRTDAKREAIRLLGADPTATPLLREVLRNRMQSTELRNASAIALQALAPDLFVQDALDILADSQEADDVRAACMTGLDHFGGHQDYAGRLDGIVEQLRIQPQSPALDRAVEGYLRKR
jgi:hypothetical protein